MLTARARSVVGVAFLVSASACAQGYEPLDERRGPLAGAGVQQPLPPAPADVEAESKPPIDMVGNGEPPQAEPEPEPAFIGIPCNMGDVQRCTCADGVSEGMQQCWADSASPSGGAFGPCASCLAPEPPPDDAPAMAGAAAGIETMVAGTGAAAAGSGGTGGAGGMGAGAMMAAGGTRAPPPPPPPPPPEPEPEPEPECDPDDCPEPLLGDACCTDEGECGTELLLICRP